MKREFERLARERRDLLVVGGGIYGAWIAYDAALRGLSVALVEKSDWAAGTSSGSSKLIHGGLRYLERLHVGLVRTSLAERKRLASLAPHLIRPLDFLIPVYKGDRVGRLRLKLGLTLYDWLAGSGQPVRPHRSIGRDELLDVLPFLAEDGLRGGFRYGDCAMDDARYTLEIVAGALGAGVVAVNRAEVTRLLVEDGRVEGAGVRDVESGDSVDVRAGLTVDCSGAWSSELLPESERTAQLTRRTKGVHLVLPSLGVSNAFLLTSPIDGRVFFLIPWYGRTLLGTTDTVFDGDPDTLRTTRADVDYLLGSANRYLSERPWKDADVLGSYVGVRTLQNEPGADPSEVTREWSLANPLPGLLMPIGGKYTSARADAAEAVDRVLEELGRPAVPCPTAERRFPWAPEEDFEPWLEHTTSTGMELGLDGETARWVGLRYGTTAESLLGLLADHHHLGGRIHPDLPFCRAEVVHAVSREMARGLEDIVRRRIPLVLLARVERELLTKIAELAGDLLGWSDQHKDEQVWRITGQLTRTPFRLGPGSADAAAVDSGGE
jgi:glycerol-3-phosphate dehydrogenase